jgi:Flp pilus assembly protein TadD
MSANREQAREQLASACSSTRIAARATPSSGVSRCWPDTTPKRSHTSRAAESLGVTNAATRANYGLALLRAGRYAPAESQLEQSVAADSTRAAAWNHLGVARLRQARPQDALAPLQHASRLEPGNEDFRFNLATALERSQRYAEAEALLRQPRPVRGDLLSLYGMVLRGAGSCRRGGAAVARCGGGGAARCRDSQQLRRGAGRNGDVPAALTIWQRVLEIEPANATARATSRRAWRPAGSETGGGQWTVIWLSSWCVRPKPRRSPPAAGWAAATAASRCRRVRSDARRAGVGEDAGPSRSRTQRHRRRCGAAGRSRARQRRQRRVARAGARSARMPGQRRHGTPERDERRRRERRERFPAVGSLYMDKIAVGPEAAGKVDLDATPLENLVNIAAAKRCYVEDLTVRDPRTRPARRPGAQRCAKPAPASS